MTEPRPWAATGQLAEPTDSDLVRQAQTGDSDALAALYDAHYSAIYRYLRARLGDQLAAEDLTGEVFKRMLVALPNYRALGLPFRPWLFRIAHNLLVDLYRRRGQEVQVDWQASEDLAGHGPDLAAAAEQGLLFDRVLSVLSRIEPAQREVVSLRFLSGLSVRETALAVLKSEDAVKALQRRGLAALRRELAGDQM
jgi:RNA polymerase sigma-70 factor (ECF subfamily)